MLKRIAKLGLWRLADSEVMPVRRLGWRLLAVWERLVPPSPKQHSAASEPTDIAKYRSVLEPLYEKTEANTRLPSSEDDDFSGHSIDKQSRSGCLIVLAPSLPKFDRNSSGLRVFHTVCSLSAHFDQVVFCHQSRTENDPLYKKAFPENVKFRYSSPRNQSSMLDEYLPKANAFFITDLFDPLYISRCQEHVERIRKNYPDCAIVLDTMDCHWKKYVRKAHFSDNNEDWCKAWNYLTLERALYPLADLLTVVTETDGQDLTSSIPNAPDYEVIPNTYTLGSNPPAFGDTQGMCFVGSASVNHNLDAMRHLRDGILPYLVTEQPQAKIYVVGTGWKKYQDEFPGVHFIFRGQISDLDKELSRYRVFVCPLTYGAGLKGKLGSAASAGIPVVTSSIGAEGYPLNQGTDCFVSDDPKEFSEYCLTLFRDQDLWYQMRNSLRALLSKRYGQEALDKKTSNLLKHF